VRSEKCNVSPSRCDLPAQATSSSIFAPSNNKEHEPRSKTVVRASESTFLTYHRP
jgi:hypothetical protein